MNQNNEPQTELMPPTRDALPVARPLTIEKAYADVMSGELSAEKLEVVKQLLSMSAEQRFNEAFVSLQSELPVITASSSVPNRGKYEKYEDILKVVQPLLTKHGFSVRFENDFRENKIGETCILSMGGYSTRTTYWTRPYTKGDDDTQKDSKTATTAKRNAFIRALNLIIRQDFLVDEQNDPRNIGTTISREDAESLQHRVKMVNANEDRFLKLAGIDDAAKPPTLSDYQKITSGAYTVLDNFLREKEGSGK